MGVARILGALALAGTVGALSITGAEAQQTQSRLYEVTKSKKLRVCQFPLYYSISFRNSKTGEIEGIDADLAKEFAKELDAKLEIVESSFGSFIADLQAGKCEIGMFGVGATMKRGQAVEFSKPYLLTNLYAVTRKDSKIKEWKDIDQKGVKAAVSLGSYMEPFIKGFVQYAEVVSGAPPNTRLQGGGCVRRAARGAPAQAQVHLTPLLCAWACLTPCINCMTCGPEIPSSACHALDTPLPELQTRQLGIILYDALHPQRGQLELPLRVSLRRGAR